MTFAALEGIPLAFIGSSKAMPSAECTASVDYLAQTNL